MSDTKDRALLRERNALELVDHFIDANVEALAALLSHHGFPVDRRVPRMLQGEWVTVAVHSHGYRITFPSAGMPHGMGVVDLPATVTYGVVEAVVLGVEQYLQEKDTEQ